MPNESDAPVVELRYTPEFKRNLRQLARKYRRIRTDLEPLLATLAAGQTPGEQVPGVQYEVFKVRLLNSDSGKGKSGGYRTIYQRTAPNVVILVTIYSKSEQSDIAPHEIREIILADEKRRLSDDSGKSGAAANVEPDQDFLPTEDELC